MLNIIICVVFFAGIFLLFRAFEVWKVNRSMAIVVNYGVASTLGWTLAGGLPAMENASQQPWFLITAIMGGAFLFLFNIIAKCTKELGVAVASISTKLSMIIPVAVFLILDPEDLLSIEKLIALILAVIAIFLASRGEDSSHHSSSKWAFMLPIVIFIGSGIIDVIFAWFSGAEYLPTEKDAMAFTSVPFTIAFLIGLAIMALPNQRPTLQIHDLLAGALLGIVNFGSLFFLLSSYSTLGLDKSEIITAINIGVVLLSTISAVIIFKDKPSNITWTGLAIGCLSIIILMLP